MQKCGRNDPCPCGSGKKFKKCCEGKSPIKRFQIEPLEAVATKGLTALFQQTFAPILEPSQFPIETPSLETSTFLEEKQKDLIT